ncbi:MAG: hypothetical protein ACKVOP_04815 [Sphingomonadaceae bacterium]
MNLVGREVADSNASLAVNDARLQALARPVAAQARPLLAASNAMLLSFTVIRGQPSPIVRCWNGPAEAVSLRFALGPAGRHVRRSLASVEIAAARLIAELARRWPSYAAPPALGIVTDGGGVVLSSDHPSPLRQDWLALHQQGLCTPTTLLPFAANGAWMLLTASAGNARVH